MTWTSILSRFRTSCEGRQGEEGGSPLCTRGPFSGFHLLGHLFETNHVIAAVALWASQVSFHSKRRVCLGWLWSEDGVEKCSPHRADDAFAVVR
jgi:hypothetical protein